jgi:hypothetical protein
MKNILLFTVCALFWTGATAAENIMPAAPKGAASEVGRYAFYQVAGGESQRYVLDTKTGRLYKIRIRPVFDNGRMVEGMQNEILEPMPYLLGQNEMSFTPPDVESNKKK